MSIFATLARPARPAAARRASLRLEQLESRLVPYSVTGNAWPSAQLVTLSFVPDGTVVASDGQGGNITSTLFATFNSHPGWTTATWQDQIIKAAQYWAQQTNLNFQVVADSGAESGSGSYQQGDPQFGDIRVGAYAMTGSVLAAAYAPPPVNNYSIAGDINFNTNYGFNVGSTYDLFTVAVHELGHALGMDHSTTSAAVMYASYNTVKTSLNSDDVAGIRSVYSNGNPRSADVYGGGAGNHSFANAVNLTSQLDPVALTTLQNGLDITTTGENDYYKVTAPRTTSGTLVVNVQTAGLSLLRQAVTVYASNKTTVLGSASSAGAYDGTTDTVTLHGVSPLQVFYIKVAGADSTAFGTGAYALALNFGSGASPTVTLPDTQLANGYPLQSGGTEAGDAPPLPTDIAANVDIVPDVGYDLLEAPAPPDAGPAGPAGAGAPGLEGQPADGAGLLLLAEDLLGPADLHPGQPSQASAGAPWGPAERTGEVFVSVVPPRQAPAEPEGRGGLLSAERVGSHTQEEGGAGERALDALFADANLLAGLTDRVDHGGV